MLTLWDGLDRVMQHELRRAHPLRQRTREARAGREPWPRVNVLATDVAFVVSAEVPGFAPEHVNVTVHDGVLTLEGQRHDDAAPEGELIVSEREARSFKRTFTIHSEVDPEGVTAVLEAGLLTVTIPKVKPPAPRQVAIHTH